MLVYATIYLFSSFVAIFKLWRVHARTSSLLIFLVIPLSIFVGYRYYIGVDWITYEFIFLDISRSGLVSALSYGDSAYSLVNWLVSRMGGEVWDVNLICAFIFSIGLAKFSNEQHRPGLTFVVNFPTLIVVTAMGYTRQSVSIACIMIAYTYFKNSINWKWLGWLALATLFHKSAIILFPIFILSGSRNRVATYLVGGLLASYLALTVVSSQLNQVLALYFEGDMDSSGTLPRIAINALAGIVYFITPSKTEIFQEKNNIIRNISIVMIALLPAYFIIPSTTVVDRIGILLVPFQGAILSALAYSFRKSQVFEGLFTLGIVSCYGAAFGVWLMYATFASYWVPYSNVLFVKWI